jgi:hypothetical protein
LGELAPEDVFGRGFVIYVQRVSVLGPDNHLWHGFDKHGPIDERPLFRSIHDYHKHFRPHCRIGILSPNCRQKWSVRSRAELGAY